MELDPPHYNYMRGWGPKAAEATVIVASWTLEMQEMHDKPTWIRFDVTDDKSPIAIGMVVNVYSITDTISTPSRVIINRPHDRQTRSLQTYTSGRTRLEMRQRLLVTPVIPTSTSMLCKTPNLQPLRATTLAKLIHNSTYASVEQTLRLCEDTEWLDSKLKPTIKDTCNNCHL